MTLLTKWPSWKCAWKMTLHTIHMPPCKLFCGLPSILRLQLLPSQLNGILPWSCFPPFMDAEEFVWEVEYDKKQQAQCTLRRMAKFESQCTPEQLYMIRSSRHKHHAMQLITTLFYNTNIVIKLLKFTKACKRIYHYASSKNFEVFITSQ